MVWVLREFLRDDENLISLAVDISEYYKKLYTDNGYIAVLENELKETEKGIANLIKVIEKGVISDAVTSRLEKLEKDKANLKEAMEAEKLKYALAEDENSIKKYFPATIKTVLPRWNCLTGKRQSVTALFRFHTLTTYPAKR